jgi:hypothetical protein
VDAGVAIINYVARELSDDASYNCAGYANWAPL